MAIATSDGEFENFEVFEGIFQTNQSPRSGVTRRQNQFFFTPSCVLVLLKFLAEEFWKRS